MVINFNFSTSNFQLLKSQIFCAARASLPLKSQSRPKIPKINLKVWLESSKPSQLVDRSELGQSVFLSTVHVFQIPRMDHNFFDSVVP